MIFGAEQQDKKASSDSEPASKIENSSEEKKPKKIIKNKKLYIEADPTNESSEAKDFNQKVELALHHLHHLLDSQQRSLTDSQGSPIEDVVIKGSLSEVLWVAHQITNHHKPDQVNEGIGEDRFHLQGNEKPSEFVGLDASEKNKLLLEKQNALESQGGELSKKKRTI